MARLEPDLADQRRRMQRAAAAERHQREGARVVAALDRHQPDRAGHARIRHAHDGLRRGHRLEPQRLADLRADGALGRLDVEPRELAADRPLGVDAAERDMGVGEGRPLAACAVAGGSRNGAGAFGADLQQAAAIDEGDRTAAGADGGDLDHRRADDEAEVDRRLRGERRRAFGDQRDVERGAAEIGGDDIFVARRAGDGGSRDHARRGAGKRRAHGIASRAFDRHDAAVRLHDVELAREVARLQRVLQAVQIIADDGLQIGVERGGGGALELADFGQDLARSDDVGVRPDRARGLGRRAFVGGIGVGVDENDGQRLGAPRGKLARPRRDLLRDRPRRAPYRRPACARRPRR